MNPAEKIRQVVEEQARKMDKDARQDGFEKSEYGFYLGYVSKNTCDVLDAIIDWKKEQRGNLIKKSGEDLSMDESRTNSLLYHAVQADLSFLEEARTSITNSIE